MKLYIGQQMVLPVLERLRLRKSRSEAAAVLSASLLSAPADALFQKLSLALGDPVRLLDASGQSVFTGSVHQLERTPEAVLLTACDRGICLTRNQLCGIYIGTPADIVRQVAEELGLSVGPVETENGWKIIVPGAGESAFSILRQAVGEKREIAVRGEALSVTKAAYMVYPIQPSRVLSARGTASIRSMVNRAVVTDRNGRVCGSAENTADVKKFGRFQSVHLQNGTDGQAEAALTGRTFFGSLTVLGSLSCQCGAAVEIHRPDWGLDGIYSITGSEHCWEAGLFTTAMQLEAAE